jgi:hypothetical protein
MKSSKRRSGREEVVDCGAGGAGGGVFVRSCCGGVGGYWAVSVRLGIVLVAIGKGLEAVFEVAY